MTVAERQTAFVPDLLGRSDYAIISDIIIRGSNVLDLGCGDGELLAWLAQHKTVNARGVEISGAKVQRAIARGVIQCEKGTSPSNAGCQVFSAKTSSREVCPA